MAESYLSALRLSASIWKLPVSRCRISPHAARFVKDEGGRLALLTDVDGLLKATGRQLDLKAHPVDAVLTLAGGRLDAETEEGLLQHKGKITPAEVDRLFGPSATFDIVHGAVRFEAVKVLSRDAVDASGAQEQEQWLHARVYSSRLTDDDNRAALAQVLLAPNVRAEVPVRQSLTVSHLVKLARTGISLDKNLPEIDRSIKKAVIQVAEAAGRGREVLNTLANIISSSPAWRSRMDRFPTNVKCFRGQGMNPIIARWSERLADRFAEDSILGQAYSSSSESFLALVNSWHLPLLKIEEAPYFEVDAEAARPLISQGITDARTKPLRDGKVRKAERQAILHAFETLFGATGEQLDALVDGELDDEGLSKLFQVDIDTLGAITSLKELPTYHITPVDKLASIGKSFNAIGRFLGVLLSGLDFAGEHVWRHLETKTNFDGDKPYSLGCILTYLLKLKDGDSINLEDWVRHHWHTLTLLSESQEAQAAFDELKLFKTENRLGQLVSYPKNAKRLAESETKLSSPLPSAWLSLDCVAELVDVIEDFGGDPTWVEWIFADPAGDGEPEEEDDEETEIVGATQVEMEGEMLVAATRQKAGRSLSRQSTGFLDQILQSGSQPDRRRPDPRRLQRERSLAHPRSDSQPAPTSPSRQARHSSPPGPPKSMVPQRRTREDEDGNGDGDGEEEQGGVPAKVAKAGHRDLTRLLSLPDRLGEQDGLADGFASDESLTERQLFEAFCDSQRTLAQHVARMLAGAFSDAGLPGSRYAAFLRPVEDMISELTERGHEEAGRWLLQEDVFEVLKQTHSSDPSIFADYVFARYAQRRFDHTMDQELPEERDLDPDSKELLWMGNRGVFDDELTLIDAVDDLETSSLPKLEKHDGRYRVALRLGPVP